MAARRGFGGYPEAPQQAVSVALGRAHKHQTVTVWVSDTTLAIELDDAETRVVRRTTTKPVRNIKADRPRQVVS